MLMDAPFSGRLDENITEDPCLIESGVSLSLYMVKSQRIAWPSTKRMKRKLFRLGMPVAQSDSYDFRFHLP